MKEFNISEYYNCFNKKLIGQGAYANVFKYKDKFYNIPFAIKKLKDNATEKEKNRFKHEYELLSKYNHPNILKAYRYIDNEQAYIMEYCEYTLKEFIESNGNDLDFDLRKNITIQFLQAIEFIHNNGIFHRDISLNNILICKNDSNIPLIKVSDFGLVKDESLDFTTTNSIIRGTIIDDTLTSFKDYNVKNEIYSIGYIIHYIFTGKQNLNIKEDTPISLIVNKCIDRNHDNRYNSVKEIINDVQKLEKIEKFSNQNNNSYIKLNSKIVDNTGISEFGLKILKDAVDSNGQILRYRDLSGLTIQSGNKAYKPSNAREEAELEDIIEKLEMNGFINATSYKRELFKVTKQGYDYFDEENIYV